MRNLLIGLIVGLAVWPAGAYLYIRLGYAPVATKAAPLPFEKKITSLALHVALSREAPRASPVPATEENLMAGARVYRAYCDACHGLIGGSKPPFALGEYPPPPQLLHGKGVTDDPVGETYGKVANGIRLTGMPAFMPSLTEVQMWQVSQMLANADKLPASVTQYLQAGPIAP